MIYFYTSRKPLFIYLFIFGLEKVSQTHSFERVGSATKYQDKRHLRILLTKRVSGNNQQRTTFLNFIILQYSQVFLIIVQR